MDIIRVTVAVVRIAITLVVRIAIALVTHMAMAMVVPTAMVMEAVIVILPREQRIFPMEQVQHKLVIRLIILMEEHPRQ